MSHERLRVAVHQREPGALHLHHDPVAAAERVADVGQRELAPSSARPARTARASRSCCGTCRGTLAADQLLVAAHAARRVGFGLGVREVVGVDVDQLHDPVGVGAGRGDVQLDLDRPGDASGPPRAARSGRPARPAARTANRWSAIMYSCAMPMPIFSMNGTGFAGSLTYSSTPRPRPAGPARASLPSRVEVDSVGLRPLRRPGVEPPPAVRAGLEHPRLRRGRLRPCPSGGARRTAARSSRGSTPPSWRRTARRRARRRRSRAQPPWTHGPITSVLSRLRLCCLDRLVRLERAEQVLGVEPAADGQHRRLDVLQVRPQVARLPEVVVVAVRHHLVPERRRRP